MYFNHNTSVQLNNLLFSVWDISDPYGHAMFAGSLGETLRYLEKNYTRSLEVSALDCHSMYSLKPVTAEEWLSWYYDTAGHIRDQEKQCPRVFRHKTVKC